MKIMIAAGGTGGHLFPAQKLASRLKEDQYSVFFMGHGLKSGFFNRNFKFFEVKSASLKENKLIFSFKLLFGFLQALTILLKERPKKAIGFGSFHTFPALLAAKVLKIPIVIVEANVKLGKVNRFFSKDAYIIHTLKNRLELPKKPGKSAHPFTILIFGGSQGAVFINHWVKGALLKLGSIKVIHLTGKNTDPREIQAFYDQHHIKAQVKSFEENMDSLYQKTSLVVSRAGGATLKELIDYEIPAFLIPYPYATENHQKENAEFFCKEVGGGYYQEEKMLKEEYFLDKLCTMRKNLKSYKKRIYLYKAKQTLLNLKEVMKTT